MGSKCTEVLSEGNGPVHSGKPLERLAHVGAEAILALVGGTPLIPLHFEDCGRTIHVKCEFMNPSGSIKDRFATQVLTDARGNGFLTSDSEVVECSSGNTGISLAMVGAAMGIRVTILMGASASCERRLLLEQLGAKVVLLPAGSTYQDGIDLSRRMAVSDPKVFLPRQFENRLNLDDHRHGTGIELIRQMNVRIDAFVSGYGTGGTLSGCGLAIKDRWPDARVFAMEPANPGEFPGAADSCFCIEGIANGGFRPALLGYAPIDGIVKVSALAAIQMTKRLHREFGLLVGTSSGANVSAALAVARAMVPEARVATVLCDRAERYFSTALFSRCGSSVEAED